MVKSGCKRGRSPCRRRLLARPPHRAFGGHPLDLTEPLDLTVYIVVYVGAVLQKSHGTWSVPGFETRSGLVEVEAQFAEHLAAPKVGRLFVFGSCPTNRGPLSLRAQMFSMRMNSGESSFGVNSGVSRRCTHAPPRSRWRMYSDGLH